MSFKKGLASLLIAGAVTGASKAKTQELWIYTYVPICPPPITIIESPPIYVSPPIIIGPPVIVEPPIYILPTQFQVVPKESPKERIFKTEDLVSREHGHDLFVKYSNYNVYEKIGEIPSSSFRIAFVKNKLERIANPQVDELPSIGWNETWINGNRAWVQIPRKKRDYNLHSIICNKESYDVYALTPDRSSETGKWVHIGKINPGGDRLIFSDNESVTVYK